MISTRIINLLKKAESIIIMAHINPDGDGLGSSLALGLALKGLGKSVKILVEDYIPEMYRFLPACELIEKYETASVTSEYAAVALDSGDRERLGKRIEVFDRAAWKINIDHHITNTNFGELNLVQPDSSSVGEMVYQLIKMMGLALSQDMAVCLYTAIATDTGGFRYENTTSVTHQVVSDLINNGADVSELSQKVFESESLEKLKLIGYAINSLELLDDGAISLVIINGEMLKNSGARDEDCEKVVNVARSIRGVKVAVMMRQKESGEIKVSLRSKNDVDVSRVAERFSGGGHARAAGCTLKTGFESARDLILNDIRREMKG